MSEKSNQTDRELDWRKLGMVILTRDFEVKIMAFYLYHMMIQNKDLLVIPLLLKQRFMEVV